MQKYGTALERNLLQIPARYSDGAGTRIVLVGSAIFPKKEATRLVVLLLFILPSPLSVPNTEKTSEDALFYRIPTLSSPRGSWGTYSIGNQGKGWNDYKKGYECASHALTGG